MKNLYLIPLLICSVNAFSSDYFSELRLGIEDNYKKVVNHASNGKLQGNFKGQNFGLRVGYKFGNQQTYIEYNPQQNVEIKSANELAKVQSTFIGYRYFIMPEFFLGGQIGHSSFELEKGPNGVTFADNPKTDGMTYGLNLGYKYNIKTKFYIGADLVYNIGSYKKDGPSSNAVDDIEIQNQSQINIHLGMTF